ncbi:hypothetical protein Rs2_09897 [Raphanus sativus]|nr:hypothetical protein Rs2_09897 [Raphanus sativus]
MRPKNGDETRVKQRDTCEDPHQRGNTRRISSSTGTVSILRRSHAEKPVSPETHQTRLRALKAKDHHRERKTTNTETHRFTLKPNRDSTPEKPPVSTIFPTKNPPPTTVLKVLGSRQPQISTASMHHNCEHLRLHHNRNPKAGRLHQEEDDDARKRSRTTTEVQVRRRSQRRLHRVEETTVHCEQRKEPPRHISLSQETREKGEKVYHSSS